MTNEEGLLAGTERLLGPPGAMTSGLLPRLWSQASLHAPAWPSLHAHLMLTQADGRDALEALTVTTAYRGLGDADDPAAVLLSRLDRAPAGGPLPWLPAIPKRLATEPVWAGYLTARTERVRALAAQVRQGSTPGSGGPRPSRTTSVLSSSPTFPCGRYARGLLCRVTGQLPDALRHWERLIVEHVGHRDWFTPEMSERLDRLHRAGVDVPDRLEQATAQGPLPDDEVTSALWFRMIDPQG